MPLPDQFAFAAASDRRMLANTHGLKTPRSPFPAVSLPTGPASPAAAPMTILVVQAAAHPWLAAGVQLAATRSQLAAARNKVQQLDKVRRAGGNGGGPRGR